MTHSTDLSKEELFRLSTTEPDPRLRKQYADMLKAEYIPQMGENEAQYEIWIYYHRVGYDNNIGPFPSALSAIRAAVQQMKGYGGTDSRNPVQRIDVAERSAENKEGKIVATVHPDGQYDYKATAIISAKDGEY